VAHHLPQVRSTRSRDACRSRPAPERRGGVGLIPGRGRSGLEWTGLGATRGGRATLWQSEVIGGNRG
jgi:hypothetical protein